MPMVFPSLVHRCPRCTATTSVPASASVFSEIQHCTHCGTPSHGIFVSDDIETARTATMMHAINHQQQQDELSKMFAQTMTLTPITPPPDARTQPAPPTLSHYQSGHEIPQDHAIVYTSMHYTPTRHMVPVRFTHTPEATPERQLPLTDEEMIYMLEQNSIDPHGLFESQVHLLRHADPEQRLRLLELWRISPPSVGSHDLSQQQQSWTSTSVEQEEQMAKIRYERMTAERFGPTERTGSSMSDEMITSSNSAPKVDRPASAPGTRTSAAEPYMTFGYEMLARRDYELSTPLRESSAYNHATDPVYMQQQSGKGGKENLPYTSSTIDDDMEL